MQSSRMESLALITLAVLGLTASTIEAQERPAAAARPVRSAVASPPTPSVDPLARRTQVPDLAAIAAQPEIPAFGGGQSISLNAALYGAITGNPDLVSLRQNAPATAEAVEVARRFPTTLNPTFWVDYRPNVYEPRLRSDPGRGFRQVEAFINVSYRQPVEFGHQTTHRYAIAKAAFSQAQWAIVQAELLAIVQTYRLYQTAEYRRERLRVASKLAEFNNRLQADLKRRLELNPSSAADVALGEVEAEATRQLVDAAQNDYAVALTDLHNQIGTPETAGQALPSDPFVAPSDLPTVDEGALVSLAIVSRPEIHSAKAQVAGAMAAIKLAKGDRIPTAVLGPEYQRDQQGRQYIGFIAAVPLPIVNNGTPLVRQREAEYRRALIALQQLEQRTTTQVRAAVAKWNQARRLVSQTQGLTKTLSSQVAQIERLFEANQADLTKLLQARQRLIQLENAELDAVWQATQAHADLLTALGAPNLINALMAPIAAAEATQPPAPPAP